MTELEEMAKKYAEKAEIYARNAKSKEYYSKSGAEADRESAEEYKKISNYLFELKEMKERYDH